MADTLRDRLREALIPRLPGFTGKADEVLGFLATFGLNQAEALEIMAAVGTAP
jgi:hypothetical protein